MATNFGTKSAITGFVWTIATRRLVREGGLSGRPTECRYCWHPATKGRCHGNQFWDCISCKWTLTEDNDMRLSCKGWLVISHLWRWELLQTGDCQVGNWHVNCQHSSLTRTGGYATMVHSRGCNPHRCTTTFANVEITSLWRHNWETIRDRQKRRPPHAMKSSKLSNGENRIILRQLLQNRKLRHLWRHNLGSRWKL